MDKFRLDGEVALVTGGAGLLGKQHAKALADAGAKVILADVNQAAVIQALQELVADLPEACFIGEVADITNVDEVCKLNERVERRIGSVSILVNNAALNPKMISGKDLKETSRVENFSFDQWNSELAVGLTGAFLCAQVFGSKMALRGRGVIINVASDLALIAPDQRLYRQSGLNDGQQPVKPITYSVIKSGLLGLTRYLATYWADKGVRVNSICPGGVYNGQSDEFVTNLRKLIPMGRMARLDEYQAAMVFLASDASAYMTGANLVIEGGRTAW